MNSFLFLIVTLSLELDIAFEKSSRTHCQNRLASHPAARPSDGGEPASNTREQTSITVKAAVLTSKPTSKANKALAKPADFERRQAR